MRGHAIDAVDFHPYREYAPDGKLAPFVECYWTSLCMDTGVSASHRVFPDGCMDIVFDLSSGNAEQGRIVGTMTQPLVPLKSGLIR